MPSDFRRNTFFRSFAFIALTAALACNDSSAPAGEEGGEGTGTGTGSGAGAAVAGSWTQVYSVSGQDADVQIGGITGEPANRVYMCMSPGSGDVLYKGTVSADNRSITWDNTALPKYEVQIGGGQLRFLLPSGQKDVEGTLVSQYQKGSWGDGCNYIVGTDGKLMDRTVYVVVYWLPSELGTGTITSVRLGSKSLPLYTSREAATCDKAVAIPYPGSYDHLFYSYVGYRGEGFDGPYTATATMAYYYYYFKPGCNQLKVYMHCGAVLYCMSDAPTAAAPAPRLTNARSRRTPFSI